MNLNTLIRFAILCLFALMVVPLVAEVATNGVDTNTVPMPPVADPNDLSTLGQTVVGAVVTIIAPILYAVGRFIAPRVPAFAVGIVTAGIVAGGNWLMSYSGNPSVNPILGAVLAAIGTGLGQISGLLPKPDESTVKTR